MALDLSKEESLQPLCLICFESLSYPTPEEIEYAFCKEHPV
jgi:hypothetical protein